MRRIGGLLLDLKRRNDRKLCRERVSTSSKHVHLNENSKREQRRGERERRRRERDTSLEEEEPLARLVRRPLVWLLIPLNLFFKPPIRSRFYHRVIKCVRERGEKRKEQG